MKQSEWDSYWDKKINEHFNVKPAERIVLHEFVEKVFNEKYGIKEADATAKDLAKNKERIQNFINQVNDGTPFEISADANEYIKQMAKVDVKGQVIIGNIRQHPENEDALGKMAASLEGDFVDVNQMLAGDRLYFKVLSPNGSALKDYEGDPIYLQISKSKSDFTKTAAFGGKGSKEAKPDGADWETLITWAIKGGAEGDSGADFDSVIGTIEQAEKAKGKKLNATEKRRIVAAAEKMQKLSVAQGGVYLKIARSIAANTPKKFGSAIAETWRTTGGDYGELSDDWKRGFNAVEQGVRYSNVKASGAVAKIAASTKTYKTDVMGNNKKYIK